MQYQTGKQEFEPAVRLFCMIYAERPVASDTQSTARTSSTPTPDVGVAVDYWVINEAGTLAEPACVAELPGADRTDSPYSIAIETPICRSCSELRAALLNGLRRALAAAADRGCQLLAAGVRPDQLDGGQDGPPPETAGARVRFRTDPETAVTVYNVLLAVDSAFVLLTSTGEPTNLRRGALVRGSQPVVQRYRAARPTPEGVDTHDPNDRWQPVGMIDDSTVEWRALESSTPTLLVDLVADILTVLKQATDCRIEVGSFGSGLEVDCLRLPTVAWRQQYLDDAISEGLDSLRLRAYLERLGFDTGWYQHIRPPAVMATADRDRRARCRRQADLLAADA